jgi:hypothetical protein
MSALLNVGTLLRGLMAVSTILFLWAYGRAYPRGMRQEILDGQLLLGLLGLAALVLFLVGHYFPALLRVEP